MGHYTSRRLWNLYSAGRLWSPTTGQAYGQAGLFQRYILWRIMTGCCHLACAEISILLCHTQSGQTKDLNRTTRSTPCCWATRFSHISPDRCSCRVGVNQKTRKYAKLLGSYILSPYVSLAYSRDWDIGLFQRVSVEFIVVLGCRISSATKNVWFIRRRFCGWNCQVFFLNVTLRERHLPFRKYWVVVLLCASLEHFLPFLAIFSCGRNQVIVLS